MAHRRPSEGLLSAPLTAGSGRGGHRRLDWGTGWDIRTVRCRCLCRRTRGSSWLRRRLTRVAAGAAWCDHQLDVNTKALVNSYCGLLLDLSCAKALVWIVSVGRNAELTPEAHIYFFDRYRRLAEYHRARRRLARARRLQVKAEDHYQAAGGDGPPYAAALAMPQPRRFIRTDAVSVRRFDGPDDVA